MGMDQKVVFARERTPSWTALVELLASANLAMQLRMIDGELSFPEEQPGENWRELRVSVKNGMITLRRETDGISLVIWGNADVELLRAWNALAWGLAHLSGGTVGTQTAEEFRRSAGVAANLPSE